MMWLRNNIEDYFLLTYNFHFVYHLNFVKIVIQQPFKHYYRLQYFIGFGANVKPTKQQKSNWSCSEYSFLSKFSGNQILSHPVKPSYHQSPWSLKTINLHNEEIWKSWGQKRGLASWKLKNVSLTYRSNSMVYSP